MVGQHAIRQTRFFLQRMGTRRRSLDPLHRSCNRVPRIPQSFLDEELEACGQQYFDQEYLCKFHATYDAVFDEETILRAVSPDIQPLLPDGY